MVERRLCDRYVGSFTAGSGTITWTLPFGLLVMFAIFNRLTAAFEEAARDFGGRTVADFALCCPCRSSCPRSLRRAVSLYFVAGTRSRLEPGNGRANTLPMELQALTTTVPRADIYAWAPRHSTVSSASSPSRSARSACGAPGRRGRGSDPATPDRNRNFPLAFGQGAPTPAAASTGARLSPADQDAQESTSDVSLFATAAEPPLLDSHEQRQAAAHAAPKALVMPTRFYARRAKPSSSARAGLCSVESELGGGLSMGFSRS